MSIINNRYAIQRMIGSGGMGAVYEAHDRLTGTPVALKRLHVSFGLEDDKSRLALAREFRTLSSLRHPHIISVLTYGFDIQRTPFYTMTLLHDGESLINAAYHADFDTKIKYCIQALQALAYLHRRGITHRDIKPSNILITPDQKLFVLDFGLADSEGISRDKTLSFTGTLAYSAPEVLTGNDVTPLADIFAMGVVMYELFAGRHPFDTSNVQTLVYDLMRGDIDWSRLQAPPELTAIIARMMAFDPPARYPNADDIISDLTTLLQQTAPSESPALRESYLQAAAFVGRQHELDILNTALSAVLNGIGSAWLIGGESGAGKTRLVEQIRTLALVKGAQVIGGQAVAEGGLSFHVWRDIVAQLLLSTSVNDLDAGVLRRIVPTIEHLLGRPVPEPPSLGDVADHQRLVSTISALVRRQATPTVLLLEDLHWATESLLPIQQLQQAVNSLPLLIIGTYRNDEAPDLPIRLPQMRVIALPRLNHSEIQQLTASIIGPTDNLPALVNYLDEQTEGNVFFIVETVRELAKEAGRLSAVSAMQLPTRIRASGIQAVIARRLSRLAPDEQMVLKMAATAGRDLDLKVLRELLRAYKIDDVGAFLGNAVNTAILDVQDGRYRFAHDKIREAMLDATTPRERPYVHRWVAQAIEAAYPQDPDQAIYLAEHYLAAGDTERMVHYTITAGQARQSVSAYREAALLYQRALDIMDYTDPRRADTLIRLGDSYLHLGDYPAAQTHLQQSLAFAETITDHFARANALYCLSQVAVAEGDFERAEQLLLEGFDSYLSHNTPILGRLYYGLADIKWRQNDLDAAEHYSRLSLEMAETAQDHTQMLYAYNRLGTVAFFRGDLDAAETIHRANRDRALAVGNLERANASIGNLGAIAIERGDYRKARQYTNESLAIAGQIGHWQAQMLQASNIATIDILEGDFEAARRRYRMILDMSLTKNTPTFILIAISGYADIALRTGAAATAVTWLTLVMEHPAADVNVINEGKVMLDKAMAQLDAPAIAAALHAASSLTVDAIVDTLLAAR